MQPIRNVARVLQSQPTLEGAGVRLRRAFGFHEVPLFDPFLLLDDFHSSDPDDYTRGFPWHPHRGIETVTYMLAGVVEHGDSLGNAGVIRSGDVQWMTAGSGIVHQEMPRAYDGDFRGLQLWVNLPRSHKMMPPRYRDVPAATIPEVRGADGSRIRVIAGAFADTAGPVRDIVREPTYLDVTLPPSTVFEHPVPSGHTAFAYLLEGQARFGPEGSRDVPAESVVLLDREGVVGATAGGRGARFLLVSGEPLKEPVAWRGPIVMNTDAELDLAFHEYHEGTFLKS